MNTQQIKNHYYTCFDKRGIKRNGSHEEHDVASLSKRLMLDPQTCHDLIAAGHLQPVSTNEDGSRLGFHSDHLDEIRKHVVDNCSDDAEAGAGTNGNFAAARALVNLQRKSEVAAAKHQQLVRFNRLASIRPDTDIEFGLGALIGEGLAGTARRFFAGATGSAIKGALKTGAVGALAGGAIGGVAGAGKAVMHNITSSDPQDHESVLGGALHGAVAGGAIGGTIGAAASIYPSAPAMVEEVTSPKFIGENSGFKGGQSTSGSFKPGDRTGSGWSSNAGASGASGASGAGASGGSVPPTGATSANPYAGTPKEAKWDAYQSMNRMASESRFPGERNAAASRAAFYKQRHDLAARLARLVEFARRGKTINFSQSYEDIVASKFMELKAGGMDDLKAKSQAFDFGVKRHGDAYRDFRSRGGQINFAALRTKSPGGLNTEEVASGVPSGQMLPATSGQSQPLYDKAQTVATRRIAGVAESAQGDVDPVDPWSDSRAVNITNNPEFINTDRDAETSRILSKIHRLNGRKVPGHATASM